MKLKKPVKKTFDPAGYVEVRKKLETYINKDMKAHIENNVGAKEKVGAMLLAYEYFNAISEINIKYDEREFLEAFPSFGKRLFHKLKIFFFIFFILFLVSLAYINAPSMIEYFNLDKL